MPLWHTPCWCIGPAGTGGDCNRSDGAVVPGGVPSPQFSYRVLVAVATGPAPRLHWPPLHWPPGLMVQAQEGG